MKTIGRIELKDEDGCTKNESYAGGIIVKLTPSEATVLRALQDAMDGRGWTDISALLEGRRQYPDDDDMSDVFMMIKHFVMAKFEVNAMREMVDRLDELLSKLEDR